MLAPCSHDIRLAAGHRRRLHNVEVNDSHPQRSQSGHPALSHPPPPGLRKLEKLSEKFLAKFETTLSPVRRLTAQARAGLPDVSFRE